MAGRFGKRRMHRLASVADDEISNSRIPCQTRSRPPPPTLFPATHVTGHVVKNWKQRWFSVKDKFLLYSRSLTVFWTQFEFLPLQFRYQDLTPLNVVPLQYAAISIWSDPTHPFSFIVDSTSGMFAALYMYLFLF